MKLTTQTTSMLYSLHDLSRARWCFNGSIFVHPSKEKHIIYRCQDTPTSPSWFCVSSLDANLKPTDCQRLQLPFLTVEDPRVAVHEGDIYVFFNSGAPVGGLKRWRNDKWAEEDFTIFCARFSSDYKLLSVDPLVWDGRAKVEKNWCPFFSKETKKWTAIYSMDPWIVLEFDKNWVGSKTYEGQGIRWGWGVIRGGSTPLFVPPATNSFSFDPTFGYHTFFHSRYSHPVRRYEQPPEYVAGHLLMSYEPPYLPLGMSVLPIMEAKRRSAVGAKVVFPSGCYQEGNRLVISSGTGDRDIRIDTFELDELTCPLWWKRL